MSLRNVVLGLGCLALLAGTLVVGGSMLASLDCSGSSVVEVHFENRSSAPVTDIAFDSFGTVVGTLGDLSAFAHGSKCLAPEFERPLSVTFVDATGATHRTLLDGYFVGPPANELRVVFDGEQLEVHVR